MSKEYELIELTQLKAHEDIDPENLDLIKSDIKSRGYIINPIIVDKESLVILDGHHRVQALKDLKYKRVPVHFVNYFKENIKIYLNSGENILLNEVKGFVIKVGDSKYVLPPKSTRHLLKDQPQKINLRLPYLHKA